MRRTQLNNQLPPDNRIARRRLRHSGLMAAVFVLLAQTTIAYSQNSPSVVGAAVPDAETATRLAFAYLGNTRTHQIAPLLAPPSAELVRIREDPSPFFMAEALTRAPVWRVTTTLPGWLGTLREENDVSLRILDIFIDPESGALLKIQTRFTEGSAQLLPFLSGRDATRWLQLNGPEIWTSFPRDLPETSFLDALWPDWGTENPAAPIGAIGSARQITAFYVMCELSPFATPDGAAPAWVIVVRGIPSNNPSLQRTPYSHGHFRHIVHAKTNDWLGSRSERPTTTPEVLIAHGLLDPEASQDEYYRVRRNVNITDGSRIAPPVRGRNTAAIARSNDTTDTIAGIPPTRQSGEPTASVTLGSTQHGLVVNPGDPIDWQILCELDGADSLGLTAFVGSLIADGSNPGQILLSPATATPSEMIGFDRPLGITNPPPGGYSGTPVSGNLLEIGGSQNTFGVPLATGLGEDTVVDEGVATSPGGQTIAEGVFSAPTVDGSYLLRLDRVFVNALSNNAGFDSYVQSAEVMFVQSEIAFEVEGGCNAADVAVPFGVLNFDDTLAFLTAFGAMDPSADLAPAFGVFDFDDVLAHLTAFSEGCP